jgi:predicted  nucleic acid-binding Zn-ribbon protein
MKYDNLARTLSMIKDELNRAEERVKNADARLVVISEDLQTIGENQKQLEVSEEKARRREEKYQDQIKQLNIRLTVAINRSEYAEMNISKLHHRIDEIEDEIIREKLKINAVSGQLDETFNDMISKF